MSERFQTFVTRLRPHRVAALTDVNDPTWEQCSWEIIEYLTQLWGGYHSLIVPTDGKAIDTVFWKFLSAFDPDIITSSTFINEQTGSCHQTSLTNPARRIYFCSRVRA